jgi:hypothetical protein
MPLGPGAALPQLELPSLDGEPRPLGRDLGLGPALVVLAHADCGTSRLALPFVDRLHRRRAHGTSVVAVLQEDAAGARALAVQLGLALPIVLDREPYDASRRLAVETVPTLYLVGAAGRVLSVHEGFRRDAFESLAAALGVPGPLFTAADDAPALRPG